MNSRGFTLVEAMLATALAAALVASLAGLAPDTVMASRRLGRTQEEVLTAGAILTLIARDLRCADPASIRWAGGTPGGHEDVLSMMTDASGTHPNQVPLLVRYRLTSAFAGDGRSLWRCESGIGAPEPTACELVAENVAELTLAFHSDGSWSARTGSAAKDTRAVRMAVRMAGQRAATSRELRLPAAIGRTPQAPGAS